MLITRSVAENALLNKHELKRFIDQGLLIKGLPLVDSTKPEHIEEIAGNEMRLLNAYAPLFDWAINIIGRARATGHIEKLFKPRGENYITRLYEPTWKAYFIHDNYERRAHLARQIMQEMQTGFTIIKGKNPKSGMRYIRYVRPIIVTARQINEDGTAFRDILFNTELFEGLITGNYKGDGYIDIQPNLFPLLDSMITEANTNESILAKEATKTGTKYRLAKSGEATNARAIYKLNLHGALKNTHGLTQKSVSRRELLEKIAPESIDTNGNLTISITSFRERILWQIKKSLAIVPHGMLVSNLFLGGQGYGDGNTATLYFRTNNNEKD